MKKSISVLITLLLVVFLSSAFADTEEEILFRGLSWDSTSKEVLASFEDKDIAWSSMGAIEYGERNWVVGFEVESISLKDFSVAGNPVSSIVLRFAYALDPETNKPLSTGSAILIQAQYRFDSKNNDMIMENDLNKKLSSLYGPADNSISDGSEDDYAHYWYWNGANNSRLNLYHSYTKGYSSSPDVLEVTYTAGHREELLDAYYGYLEIENMKNTDGL